MLLRCGLHGLRQPCFVEYLNLAGQMKHLHYNGASGRAYGFLKFALFLISHSFKTITPNGVISANLQIMEIGNNM